MKKLLPFLWSLLSVFISFNSTSQVKSASILYLGAGTNVINSESKDLGFSNPFNIDIGFYQPLWKMNNSGLGIHLFGQYGFGKGETQSFSMIPIMNATSSLESPTSPKFSGLTIGAGPQLHLRLSPRAILSPIIDFAYVKRELDEFDVKQQYEFSGSVNDFSLYKQSESKTSGLGIIPRLHFQYFFSKSIGLWIEGHYSILPDANTTVERFVPNGDPLSQSGEYNVDQIMAGQSETSEKTSNLSGVGFNLGIAFRFGKQKEKEQQKQEDPANQESQPPLPFEDAKGDSLILPDENGIVFIATPMQKRSNERKGCLKFLSPENGSAYDSDKELRVLIKTEKVKKLNPKVTIYKISDDADFWLKPENKEKLVYNANPALSSMRFEREAKATGFKPITISLSEKEGQHLMGRIKRGVLSKGAYRVVARSSCGVTSSAFVIIPSADLTTDSLVTKCKEKFGEYSYKFFVSNKGGEDIKITSIPSFNSSSGTISSFVLDQTLPIVIPAGGSFTFTGSFSYSGSYPSNVYASVSGHQVGNPSLKSFDTETGILESCVCHFCDAVWKAPDKQSNKVNYEATDHSLSIHQQFGNVSLPPGVMLSGAKAEIISFRRKVRDECFRCDKDSKHWGNFIGGHSGQANGYFSEANGTVAGYTHHTIYFYHPNNIFDLNISIPPLSTLKCCCEKIWFKIRYTYIFKDEKTGICKMCSRVIKYYFQKGNCKVSPDDHPMKVSDTREPIGNP